MFRYGKRTIIYGILIITLLTGCNSKSAITSEPEEMTMSSTDNIRLFTQNSIRIQSEAGIIYIDPFQIKEEAHDHCVALFQRALTRVTLQVIIYI